MVKTRKEAQQERDARERARAIAEMRALRAVVNFERAKTDESATIERHQRELRETRAAFDAASLELHEASRELAAYTGGVL